MTFIEASSDMFRALQNKINTMGTFLQHTTTAARLCESNNIAQEPIPIAIHLDHNVYQDLYPHDTLREMDTFIDRQESGTLTQINNANDELDFISLPTEDNDVNERPPSGRYFG
jgi:hypothetical protein